MSHAELITFLIQLAVMLATALIGGQVMRRLKQPAVLGELLGGIFLGPTFLGVIAPGVYGALFPDSEALVAGRDIIMRLGVLFFLFVAGLEVELHQIRQHGLGAALTGLLGIALPFTLGVGAVFVWPQLWGPLTQRMLPFALFMGVALSISALPVIARILMDLQLIKTRIGTIVMTAAMINDFLGWILFALILGIAIPPEARRSPAVVIALFLGFVVLVLGPIRWFSRPLTRWARAHLAWPSGLIGVVAAIILIAAAVAEAIGVHAVLGAFLVGIAFSRNREEDENHAHQVIQQFALSFFAPLYFVSVGLQVNFAANFDLLLFVVIFTIACAGKIVGAGVGAWAGGLALREALAVGFAMNARGAMEIILASAALEAGLIDQRIFVALVLMALVTSLLSAPLLQGLVGQREFEIATRP